MSGPSTAPLPGAIIAGVFGLITWWLNRRAERRAGHDAWQAHAEELRDELRAAHAEQIADLQARLSASDVEIRRLQKLWGER